MKPAETKDFRLVTGGLSVTLSKTGTGISLKSIKDTRNSKKLLSEPRVLFTMKAVVLATNETISADSQTGWNFVDVIKASDKLYTIILSGNEKLSGVTVTITASLEGNRITWKISLVNDNSEISLTECDYPILSFDSKTDNMFFSPYGCGEIYSSAKEGGFLSEQNYPSYGASMQYLAFWNEKSRRGIYCGLHDPAPAYKKIHYSRKADEKAFTLKIVLPLTNTDIGANSQELYGKCVWELFDGDWYDAALIYRDWVWNEARWMTRYKPLPEWMKKNNHWWLLHNMDGFKAEDVAELNKDLGVDSATHIYYWHQIPFDNDYPHYFPLKQEYFDLIQDLKKLGIRTMTYINGRLWDTKDRGMEDWQFSSVAKPYTTKEKDGTMFIEKYNSEEADGSKVELSIMCPSSAVWQEKVKEIVDRLFNEVGVDAVYIDQIAAAKPNLCQDKTHNHPAGGGTWWCDSYNNLLDHVVRTMPENCTLTTECTADPFMKYMSAYLSWLWVKNSQVPAFPAIYSDYMATFGICYSSFKDNDGVCMRVYFAQSLLYGEQMGWMRPEQYKELPFKGFYKKLVRLRAKLGEYFYDGRMLRPPYLKDNAPRMYSTNATEAYGGIIDYAAVQGGLWQRKRDDKQLLLLINTQECETVTQITTDAPDGTYDLNSDVSGKLIIKEGRANITLPALSVAYIEI
ncbi:MAG: hypothetical protein A2Y17_13580 [Clostridiales bacterium GWF2_38_85]|nr:MAG: hypothetical protein A2Y17_13580 [Clostridiales bacterium GWF2_38_85]